MKYFTFLTFVLFFFLADNATGQEVFTLDKAIDYALGHHLSAENAKLKIKEAQQRIYETRAIGLPQVNASASESYFIKKPIVILPDFFGMGNPNFDPKVSFSKRHNLAAEGTASMLLFNSTYLQGLKAARAYKIYAEEDYQAVSKKIKDEVTDAFLPVLFLAENLTIINKNIKTLKEFAAELKEMHDAGFVELLDVQRVDLTLSNLITQAGILQRNQQLTKEALKLAMGYPLDQDIEIQDDLDRLLEKFRAEGMDTRLNLLDHPAYRALTATEHLNEINIKAKESAYYPNLTGFVNYKMQWQGDKLKDLDYTPQSVAGLKLNVPIFAGLGTKAKVEQAKIQLDMIRNNKENMARGLNFQVRRARMAIENANATIRQREEALNLAEKIYNTARTKYKEGVGSSLEMNQAETALFQARQNLLAAKFDLLKAFVGLRQALGN